MSARFWRLPSREVVASTAITPQPVATTIVDFTNADGTGEDLVFPVGSALELTVTMGSDVNMITVSSSALIRSANGDDYAYIYHQDSYLSITTTTTPEMPATSYTLAGASFDYVAPSCEGGGDVPLARCFEGTWTFSNADGTILADTEYGGVAFSVIFAAVTDTATGTITPDAGFMPAMTLTMPTTILSTPVWEFETGQTNSEVASVVAAFQTKVSADIDSTTANVTVTVKGARDRVNFSRDGDNQNIRYSVDAYIFETEYSALGLWIEDPREFLGLSTVAWDPDVSDSEVFYFGLQTPTVAGILTTGGIAEYSGIAAGRYLRNGGESAADRFAVSGVVNLTANFDSDAGIDGTADLTAYGVTDLATSSGVVTVRLTDAGNNPDSNRATFSGTTSILGTAAGVFSDLGSDVVAGESEFEGYFTGPRAEEAVGRATVQTGGNDLEVDDFLEFGFLTTRQEP